ncbi:HAD-IA family hydrolase [Streptomyces sp. NPDC057239]|uniref:HAD-IA family hydrolase n=1 Tax=Streptomyces sp. NPDC057239 TaxID=3346061 RepID=UPI00363C23B3
MNTPSTTPAPHLEALILDCNGVIGRQPTPHMWARLAALAGWPADQTTDFETAFWARRAPYDAGETTPHAFWRGLLHGQLTAPQGSALLDALRTTDAEMWTYTDETVIRVLQAAHATGLRLIILSNTPHPLADTLDRAPWCSILIAKTVYSARLGVNKPDPRAYEAALAAAGWPDPATTLFVDDRRENCVAAAQLGLCTLHFDGDSQALATHIPQLVPVAGARN